jgi:hypothetical protein
MMVTTLKHVLLSPGFPLPFSSLASSLAPLSDPPALVPYSFIFFEKNSNSFPNFEFFWAIIIFLIVFPTRIHLLLPNLGSKFAPEVFLFLIFLRKTIHWLDLRYLG